MKRQQYISFNDEIKINNKNKRKKNENRHEGSTTSIRRETRNLLKSGFSVRSLFNAAGKKNFK